MPCFVFTKESFLIWPVFMHIVLLFEAYDCDRLWFAFGNRLFYALILKLVVCSGENWHLGNCLELIVRGVYWREIRLSASLWAIVCRIAGIALKWPCLRGVAIARILPFVPFRLAVHHILESLDYIRL